MNLNPYEPPTTEGPPKNARGALFLAAIGAWLASGYWALVTLLLWSTVGAHGTNATRLVLPAFLIVIYAVRGSQMLAGNVAAARRILWLHGVGGVVAVLQMAGGVPMVMALNGLKVLIHIFGGIMAWRAVNEPRPLT